MKLIVTILISKWVNGKQNNVNPACFPSPPQSLSSSLESRSDRNPLGVPFLVAHVQHPEKPHPFLVAPSLFKGPIIVIPKEKPVIKSKSNSPGAELRLRFLSGDQTDGNYILR